MTSAELPEPEPDRTPAPAGRAVRRSRAAWAVLAVAVLVAGVLAVVSRGDERDGDTDLEIALPTPAQVLMGGQSGTLGSDPDRGVEANVWLNVSGPGSSTSNGDLFHSGDGEIGANSAYDPDGHLFAVSVTDAAAGRDLVIDAYDPAWVSVGDHCENEAGRATSSYDATVEPSPRCTGDQLLGRPDDASSTVTTTYLVRGPDATPEDATDNPVVCASTYAGWPDGPNRAPDPRAPAGVITTATYQMWDSLCRVPAAAVQPGAYIVQVRTNADLGGARWATDGSLAGDAGTLVGADPGATGVGANRFSLRAGWAGDDGAPDDAVTLQAIGHLSIYVNGIDAAAEFALVRVPTSAAGRSLSLGFWDLGDVRGVSGLRLTVGAPAGARSASDPAAAAPLACEVPSGREQSLVVDGCTIDGITTSMFNAAMLEVRVVVPDDYRCDAEDDCWLPLRLEYPGAFPSDTTTWQARWDQDGSTPRETPGRPGTSVPAIDDPVPTTSGTLVPTSSTSSTSTPTSSTTTSRPPSTGPRGTQQPVDTAPPGTARGSGQ